jgi:hypothetical protein
MHIFAHWPNAHELVGRVYLLDIVGRFLQLELHCGKQLFYGG